MEWKYKYFQYFRSAIKCEAKILQLEFMFDVDFKTCIEDSKQRGNKLKLLPHHFEIESQYFTNAIEPLWQNLEIVSLCKILQFLLLNFD